MNNDERILITVIVLAFIAGYSIVSFIVKKFKMRNTVGVNDFPDTGPQNGQTQPDESSKDDEAEQDTNRQEQYKRWEQEQARRRSETWESQSEEKIYASVLGLHGKVSSADVKIAYRDLLAKYHPDKVNHLGDEFKDIAEQKTREILAAYDFFRRKYNL